MKAEFIFKTIMSLLIIVVAVTLNVTGVISERTGYFWFTVAVFVFVLAVIRYARGSHRTPKE